MEAACEAIGVDPTNATLLRLGENAIFEVADRGLVVRIARGTDLISMLRKRLRLLVGCVRAAFLRYGPPILNSR